MIIFKRFRCISNIRKNTIYQSTKFIGNKQAVILYVTLYLTTNIKADGTDAENFGCR